MRKLGKHGQIRGKQENTELAKGTQKELELETHNAYIVLTVSQQL